MARDFDGVDDKIINENASVSAYPFAMFAWCRADASHVGTLVMNVDSANNTDGFGINVTDGGGAFKIGLQVGTGVSELRGNTTISTDTWINNYGQFVGATQRQVFLNGESDSSSSGHSSAVFRAGDRTSIGRREGSTPDEEFNGEIAHVTIWDTGNVVANHIRALNRGANPFMLRPDNIIRYWPLNGVESPEGEYINQSNGTVTEAVKGAGSPPVEMIENCL